MVQAWTEAAECLTSRGYDVQQVRTGNNWSLTFDGEPDGIVFDLRYEVCVGDAEAMNVAYLRTQVPEGDQRLEVAAEFQSCLSAAGIPNTVFYDPTSPDAAATLRDAQIELGYTVADPDVADDPRFGEVLGCFDTYELLFPERFER